MELPRYILGSRYLVEYVCDQPEEFRSGVREHRASLVETIPFVLYRYQRTRELRSPRYYRITVAILITTAERERERESLVSSTFHPHLPNHVSSILSSLSFFICP